MQAKRMAVLGLSLVIGIALTWFIIYAAIPLPFTIPFLNIKQIGFGTDAFKFAYSNVLLLVLSLGGVIFIWLDYFLKTEFLKS
jgi:uncharacterized membrane protein